MPVWTGAAADGNWNTGGNWVGGAKPGNSEAAIFSVGAVVPTSNLDQSALTGATEFRVASTYAGASIGTSGAKYILGGTDSIFDINGANVLQIWFQPADAERGTVRASNEPNGFVFCGSCDDLYLVSGNILISATATVARLHVQGPCSYTIESGATIGAILADDGVGVGYAAVTGDVDISGVANYDHKSGNIGGTFKATGRNARGRYTGGGNTFAAVLARDRATIDFSGCQGATVADARSRSRALVNLNNGAGTIVATAAVEEGGRILGGATIAPTSVGAGADAGGLEGGLAA